MYFTLYFWKDEFTPNENVVIIHALPMEVGRNFTV